MDAVCNGKIVLKNNVVNNHSILIEDNHIFDIIPDKELNNFTLDKVYYAHNNYIIPGLIDIHSDSIENIIVPRKRIVFDYDFSLNEIDKILISQGITTIYHSISIANSTVCDKSRTLSVNKLLNIGVSINKSKSKFLINHRFHARLEINTIEAIDSLIDMIRNDMVQELSIMDHSPLQGQYKDLNVFTKEIKKQYGKISPKEQNEIINKCINKKKLSIEVLQKLIKIAKTKKIPLAYHDVDRIEKVYQIKNEGFDICEFPLSLEVAEESIRLGLFTVVGAPNILKRSSHNNNLSAIEGIRKGVVSIICSDYSSNSLLQSIFDLHKNEKIPLHKAVAFATINPAKALGIDKEKGSLEKGKIADLLVINAKHEYPNVLLGFVNGKLKCQFKYDK